jgi:hypothetical protein
MAGVGGVRAEDPRRIGEAQDLGRLRPGRCRPNTLRAVAFDLKVFFTVIPKDPVEVTAADVFEFLAHQRGTGHWSGWRTGSRGGR